MGGARVGADVAGDLAELVVRDEQLVLAAELQLDVVAGDARDGLHVEAEELADAVVLVHHVVAGAQVGEARERTAEAQRGRRPRAPAEDLRRGQEREAERARDEAAARGRDAEVDARGRRQESLGVEHARIDAAQAEDRALGVAAMRERDHHAHARADQAAQLVLGLGETARRRAPGAVLEPRRRRRERVEPSGACRSARPARRRAT